MAEVKLELDAEALAREALAKMDQKAIDRMVRDAVKVAVKEACVQVVRESTDLVPRIKQAAHDALDVMLAKADGEGGGKLAYEIASVIASRMACDRDY